MTDKKPYVPKDPGWVLSATRGWLNLERCSTTLEGWLQFKFSYSAAKASRDAEWARAELKRLGEKYERAD